ncbi:MAG: hypothetical protein JWQ97_8, partial [Phenylobacterium sp.]|nr:hypothetical protein [Phenylobacterium sp.]
ETDGPGLLQQMLDFAEAGFAGP